MRGRRMRPQLRPPAGRHSHTSRQSRRCTHPYPCAGKRHFVRHGRRAVRRCAALRVARRVFQAGRSAVLLRVAVARRTRRNRVAPHRAATGLLLPERVY